MKVGIIDYGVGNLGSVFRALEELRTSPVFIKTANEIANADCLILPGVGNFSDCMHHLNKGNWPMALQDEVLGHQKRILGICVGMQLLADSSTEGGTEDSPSRGLGFIPGQVQHLKTIGCTHRVPHVGWNSIHCKHEDNSLFNGIPTGTDFYFVHSYAFVPDNINHVIATADYGIAVTAAVNNGHIWGTQFHPEKSSRAGFKLLKNFIEGTTC